MRETGTGQQVVQFHERLMMMMMNFEYRTDGSYVTRKREYFNRKWASENLPRARMREAVKCINVIQEDHSRSLKEF